jgi:hypothetical protein
MSVNFKPKPVFPLDIIILCHSFKASILYKLLLTVITSEQVPRNFII